MYIVTIKSKSSTYIIGVFSSHDFALEAVVEHLENLETLYHSHDFTPCIIECTMDEVIENYDNKNPNSFEQNPPGSYYLV